MEDVADLERELDHVLKASGSPVAPCPVTTEDLRRLVVEYLDDYDAELARFPEVAAEGHWTLWQWDELGEFDKDSYFVAIVVLPAGLEFVCGHGPQQAVRDFGENHFPSDLRQVVPELARRFTVQCGSLRVGRVIAETWAGRGLGVRAEPGAGLQPGAPF